MFFTGVFTALLFGFLAPYIAKLFPEDRTAIALIPIILCGIFGLVGFFKAVLGSDLDKETRKKYEAWLAEQKEKELKQKKEETTEMPADADKENKP